MARYQTKTKRIIIIIVSVIALYLTVRIQNYEHTAFVHLPNIATIDAWEFVADFSNMKYLNPTIVDFSIINESGNYDHWKYSTQYSEFLSHWPHLSNSAIAYFDVRKTTNALVIDSVHKTCLFSGIFCLDSKSEFKFTENRAASGTLCEETVSYQCPAILSALCRREVAFQRKAIMNNLKKHFQNELRYHRS